MTTHEVLWQHTTFPWQKVHTVVFYEEAPTSAPPAYLSSLLESKVIAAWTLISAVQHTSKARPTYPTSSFPSRARVIANERFGSEFVETSQYLRESTSFILRDLGFESIILDERHCVVMKFVSTLLRVPDAQAEVKDWVNQLALLSAKFTKCYFILYFEEAQYEPKYFSPLLRLFGSVTTKFLLEMVVPALFFCVIFPVGGVPHLRAVGRCVSSPSSHFTDGRVEPRVARRGPLVFQGLDGARTVP